MPVPKRRIDQRLDAANKRPKNTEANDYESRSRGVQWVLLEERCKCALTRACKCGSLLERTRNQHGEYIPKTGPVSERLWTTVIEKHFVGMGGGRDGGNAARFWKPAAIRLDFTQKSHYYSVPASEEARATVHRDPAPNPQATSKMGSWPTGYHTTNARVLRPGASDAAGRYVGDEELLRARLAVATDLLVDSTPDGRDRLVEDLAAFCNSWQPEAKPEAKPKAKPKARLVPDGRTAGKGAVRRRPRLGSAAARVPPTAPADPCEDCSPVITAATMALPSEGTEAEPAPARWCAPCARAHPGAMLAVGPAAPPRTAPPPPPPPPPTAAAIAPLLADLEGIFAAEDFKADVLKYTLAGAGSDYQALVDEIAAPRSTMSAQAHFALVVRCSKVLLGKLARQQLAPVGPAPAQPAPAQPAGARSSSGQTRRQSMPLPERGAWGS